MATPSNNQTETTPTGEAVASVLKEIADETEAFTISCNEIDFASFGYPTESDERWTETREADKDIEQRTVAFMQWSASRPEQEIAVVTHSSWLKHLFRQFGHTTAVRDKETLHRLAGNAELRSISLACHYGFYPEGQWTADGQFVPEHPSFHRGRWAPSMESVSEMHKGLLVNTK